MNLKIDTKSMDAFDILVKYCVKHKISYDSLIMSNICTIIIKEPSDTILAAVYRYVNALHNMIDIKVKICTNKVEIPINI